MTSKIVDLSEFDPTNANYSAFFQNSHVPKAEDMQLDMLTFNDFRLDRDEMVLAGIRIFIDTGFLQTFKIDYDVSLACLSTY